MIGDLTKLTAIFIDEAFACNRDIAGGPGLHVLFYVTDQFTSTICIININQRAPNALYID